MAGERGADGGVTVQVDIGLASAGHLGARHVRAAVDGFATFEPFRFLRRHIAFVEGDFAIVADLDIDTPALALGRLAMRSEEHTSELQSLMRISYAVFCLKIKM